MTKSQLIEALALNQKLPSKTAASIVNTIQNTMIETLVKGDDIELCGFGTFTVRKYKTYIDKNPKTGSRISVKPKNLPFFKAGKDLRESIDANRVK